MTRGRLLEYSPPAPDAVGRAWRWLAIVLAVLPVAAVGSIHLVYVVEWVANGAEPIPPFHGPNNLVEELIYLLSHLLFFPFFFSIALDLALPAVALAKGCSRPPLLLALPTVLWAVGFVLMLVDPVGAMYFWID